MRKFRYSCMVALLLVLTVCGLGFAHRVNLFAYVESGTVYTESYFPDGRAVEGGKVMVYDSGEKLLVEGATDTEGQFSFPIPKLDDLTIVLDATMGHKNRYTLKKSEVEAGR